MLLALLCAAMAVLGLWPETPAGRFLRRWMVEAPARKLTPGLMIFAAFLLLAVVGAVAWGKTEGLVVAAQAPEAIAWFAAFDIGTYIDVLVVAWLLTATVRLRGARDACRSIVARVVQGVRRSPPGARAAREPRRHGRRGRPPPQDDERGWAGPGFACA